MQYIQDKWLYYLAIIIMVAVYAAGEYYDILACVFPFLIAAGLWLIANLIPPDQITDEWKNSRWFYRQK